MIISVIILDFLKADRVIKNVDWLLSQKWDFELEIIIVDNSCNKNNADKLLTLEKNKKVSVIINKPNTWYPKWNNIAAKNIYWDYVFIINPDIICRDSFVIAKMIEYLENNKDVWILGPKQLNDDWTIPTIIRTFPNLFIQFFRRTFLRKFPIISSLVGEDEMRFSDLDLTKEVDWIQSSFMAIRREVWDKIWWFDENYFIFMSDSEICFQCWRLEKKVIYYPGIKVYADWKRCSQWGFFTFFKSKVLRQHFYDSFKYTLKHMFESNPRKYYYLNKNSNLI